MSLSWLHPPRDCKPLSPHTSHMCTHTCYGLTSLYNCPIKFWGVIYIQMPSLAGRVCRAEHSKDPSPASNKAFLNTRLLWCVQVGRVFQELFGADVYYEHYSFDDLIRVILPFNFHGPAYLHELYVLLPSHCRYLYDNTISSLERSQFHYLHHLTYLYVLT